jgi:hypothetical protein
VCISFAERQLLNFQRNRNWFGENGFVTIDYDSRAFLKIWYEILNNLHKDINKDSVGVVIDISSMSRPMMAYVAIGLDRLAKRGVRVRALFVYCPAEFTEPGSDISPIIKSEPVIPELAGWCDDATRPPCAIVGFGYEADYALGAIEYLEPAEAWGFFPYGEDKRFDRAVEKANRDVVAMLGRERIQKYEVGNPSDLFGRLESLVYGIAMDGRSIIVPFGPKIFALSAILVSIRHSPSTTVWRVSGEQSGEPVDRTANGKVVALEAEFLS